jgi:CRP-like cAMP-binding protein
MGDPGDQLIALLSGMIRISIASSEGKELLLAIIRPGEIFDELAVLDGKSDLQMRLQSNHARSPFWNGATFCRSSSEIPPVGSR